MGISEEVGTYNAIVSKAVVAFDRDLSRMEASIEALESLGRTHADSLVSHEQGLTNLELRQAEILENLNNSEARFTQLSVELTAVRTTLEQARSEITALRVELSPAPEAWDDETTPLFARTSWVPMSIAGVALVLSVLTAFEVL